VTASRKTVKLGFSSAEGDASLVLKVLCLWCQYQIGTNIL